MTAGATPASEVIAALQEDPINPTRISAALVALGVESPDQGGRRLARWAERWGAPPEAWLTDLLGALPDSPDAPMTLLLWERWLESAEDPWSWARPGCACHLLTKLFGQSQFLSDILIGEPELAPWILEEDTLQTRWPLARLRAELEELLTQTCAGERGSDELAEVRRAMCRWRRRHLLRIGLRDILDHALIETVASELSDVAEVVVQASLDQVWAETTARWGEPLSEEGQPVGLAVVAMGKLGGRELNFSSDIDLIFLYTAEGETTGKGEGRAGRVDNHRFMRRLCERLVDHVATVGPEGRLYRVDLRLRPEGKVGPIARSLESLQIYFDTQARLWERLAHTKAHVVACRGDAQLPRRVEESLRRFVYGESPGPDLPRTLATLKHRIDREVARGADAEAEVKRGLGGIREIEFVVGLFQLIHGARLGDLRSPGLLETLRGLERHRLLTESATVRLRRAYETLRRIEHRLQMMNEFQTHSLPRDPRELVRLARRLGWEGTDETVRRRFLADFNQIISMVHQAFLQHIGAPELTDLQADVAVVLDNEIPEAQAAEILARFGFVDPEAAVGVVRELGVGGQGVYVEASAQRAFERLLPALLAWCPQVPSADLAMRQLAGFVDAYKARGVLFSLMAEQPQLVEVLMRLFGGSELLGRALIRSPQHFETVVARGLGLALPSEVLEEMWATLRPRDPSDTGRLLDALRTMRQMVRLAAALRHLLDLDPWPRFAEQLTELQEFLLRRAWRALIDLEAEEPAPVVCLALGKFGGGEINIGSDLDVIFVCRPPESLDEPDAMEWMHAMTRRAERLLNACKERTPRGRLFDLDTRLRPEGRNAPLLCTDQRLVDYFAADAQLWEFQAFLRARPVAGDLALGQALIERVHRAMRSRLGDIPLRAEIGTMRRRLEENADHAGGEGAVDLKRDPGGIVDIEFLVQLAQLEALRDRGRAPEVNTAKATAGLGDFGELVLHERATLRRHLLNLRAIECRLRLLQGSASSAIPPDAERWRQLGVAHLGPRTTADEMRVHTAEVMGEVRMYFTRALTLT